MRAPELLLLDEPTVGVDPLSRRELWQIVEQLIQGERVSVLVATAYLDEAERCARVYLLREGIESGEFTADLHPESAATALWGMLNGMLSVALRTDAMRPDTVTPQSLVTAAITIIETQPGTQPEAQFRWSVQADLLASRPEDRHFVVETETSTGADSTTLNGGTGTATVRFGDDVNGRRPPPDSTFTVTYRVGNGSAGNIGAGLSGPGPCGSG